jgi:hypothetical protein
MTISQSEFARSWLEQFLETERVTAERLADAVMPVGHDSLYRGLRTLLNEITAASGEVALDRPVALYTERAVETRDTEDEHGWAEHEVLPFFPGTICSCAARSRVARAMATASSI